MSVPSSFFSMPHVLNTYHTGPMVVPRADEQDLPPAGYLLLRAVPALIAGVSKQCPRPPAGVELHALCPVHNIVPDELHLRFSTMERIGEWRAAPVGRPRALPNASRRRSWRFRLRTSRRPLSCLRPCFSAVGTCLLRVGAAKRVILAGKPVCVERAARPAF